MIDETHLQEQQAYYNARAAEYNEWWERRGRYARGAESDARWFHERQELYDALERLRPSGHVLEIACGTGNWTLPLSRMADRVTAVDGSEEMLALNRHRVNSPRVRYLQADLFDWEPEEVYDGAVFCFWLSHVPPEQLDPFLAKLRRAVRPGGKLFFADSRREPLGTPLDQPLPEEEELLATRRLNDGREFRIVKIYYDPEELQSRLATYGLQMEVRTTERFFIYGTGTVPTAGS